jgi:hypothetical protein
MWISWLQKSGAAHGMSSDGESPRSGEAARGTRRGGGGGGGGSGRGGDELSLTHAVREVEMLEARHFEMRKAAEQIRRELGL